jgi:hypothetical protein
MTAAADPPFAFDSGQARTPVPDPDVKGHGGSFWPRSCVETREVSSATACSG